MSIEKEAEVFVSEKADKGNFDVEKFGKAYFSESSMKQALVKFAEPREKRIADLENKIADIKANCDLAIEGRDIKIKELEKENAELKKKCYKKAVKDYCELEKENAELKAKVTAIRNAKDKYDMSKDKSIIKACGAEYYLFCDLERILED